MQQEASSTTPCNVEAEQQILGAILSDNQLLDEVSGFLEPEHFYEPTHRDIYSAISELVDAGMVAGPVSLRRRFEKHEGMEALGGVSYMVRLVAASISPWAVKDYAQIVSDLAMRRELLASFDDWSNRISESHEPAVNIAVDIESAIGRVTSRNSVKPLIRSHLNAIVGSLEQINDAFQGGEPAGVATGLAPLDNEIQRLRRGQLVIIAGRPAMGKTTVAQSIAYNAAANGTGVAFLSLEMTGEELGTRFLSRGLAERGVMIPYSRMIGGKLSEPQFRAVAEESKRQQSLPMFIGERDVRDLKRLRSAVRRAKQMMADTQCPLDLVVVDYIQRVRSERARSKHEEVSHAADLLKTIAMEEDVPVVALAQLSRSVESRDTPIPMLSDLKESGSLEEDADVVIFCYREAYYLRRRLEAMDAMDDKYVQTRADLEAVEKNLDLIIAKQRSGGTGTVKVFADLPHCLITADRQHEKEALI